MQTFDIKRVALEFGCGVISDGTLELRGDVCRLGDGAVGWATCIVTIPHFQLPKVQFL